MEKKKSIKGDKGNQNEKEFIVTRKKIVTMCGSGH